MQGHAFASRFSRDWRLLKKDKKRLCGRPNDEQEGRRSHCKHYERPEMMIVRLPTQGSSLLHREEATQPRENQSTSLCPQEKAADSPSLEF
jgi:hypothetical protein